MKQAGRKSVKEELPKHRKAPKRVQECQLKVQTHIWELEAASSSLATRTTSEQSSLCSDVLFCVQQKRTPSARSFAPPFQTEPARASIRFFFLRVQNALTALRPSRNRPPSGDLTARLCRRPEGRSTRRRVRHPASLLNRQREPGHIVVFRDAQ